MQPRNLERVSIQEPCSLRWEELAGDERRRFCGQCSRHVHNLSALRADEAERLVAESAAGGRLCVTYLPGPDGRPRTLPETPRPAPRARRRKDLRSLVGSFFAGAFGVAALLAGCSVEPQQTELSPSDDAGPAPVPAGTDVPEDLRVMGGMTPEAVAVMGEVALDPPIVIRDAAPGAGAQPGAARR